MGGRQLAKCQLRQDTQKMSSFTNGDRDPTVGVGILGIGVFSISHSRR